MRRAHLSAALPPDQRIRLQRHVAAWLKARSIHDEIDEIGTSILSTDVRRRERLQAQYDQQIDIMRATAPLIVPSGLVLSSEMLPDPATARPWEVVFRNRLYRHVLEFPVRVPLALRQEGAAVVADVAGDQYTWGPHGWRLPMDADGRLTWDRLMSVQVWALEYHRFLLGEQAQVLTKMESLRREMGGHLLDLTGKKLGEIPGTLWNSDVRVGDEIGKLGGYVDDSRGWTEIHARLYGAKTARLVVQAPDGWLHLYALDNKLRTFQDFGTPGDRRARVLGEGTQVGRVRLIVGVEGIEFQRDEKGWSAPLDRNAVTSMEKFAMGAILGDWYEEPEVQSAVGQVLVGVIPIVGQVADARDVAAGVSKMWQTGGTQGKLQTGMALLGLVPLFGDAVKAAVMGTRRGGAAGRAAAVAAAHEAVPATEKALARALLEAPEQVASRFGVKAASSTYPGAREAIDAALRGDAAARGGLAKLIGDVMTECGGDGSLVIHAAGGSWKRLTKLLSQVPNGHAVGDQLNVWRASEVDRMGRALKGLHAAESAELGRRVGAPELVDTGTKKFTSDFDMSFIGPDSSLWAQRARAHLAERFSMPFEKVQDFLDLDIFTDPFRLVAFQQVGGKAGQAVERALAKQAEINTLAKIIREGGDPVEFGRLASGLGVDLNAVRARVRELDELARNPRRRVALELEVDVLHHRTLAEADPVRKAALARQMAEKQALLNASRSGSYVTPGGTAAHVATREPRLAEQMRPWLRMTPGMLYMSVLDDMAFLSPVLARGALSGFDAKAAKDLAKYADRLLVRSGQLGAFDAGARESAALFRQVSDMLLIAREKPGALGWTRRATSGPPDSVQRTFVEAAGKLTLQLASLVAQAKKVASPNEVLVLTRQFESARKALVVGRVAYGYEQKREAHLGAGR